MKLQSATGVGEPSQNVEMAEEQALGGYEALTKAGAADPAREVVGEHVERQPDGVSREPARREVAANSA